MSVSDIIKAVVALVCAVAVIGLTILLSNTLLIQDKLSKNAVAIDPNAPGAQIAQNKLPDPIMELIASADIAKGAKLSKACAACHNFEKGAAAKQGPTLWGIVGRTKARVDGFEYSEALASKGGEWNYDALNQFLTKPKKYVPGTKMNFAGLRKVEDRAAVVAWLREQSDSPEALPTQAEIDEEIAARAPPEPEPEETEAAAE